MQPFPGPDITNSLETTPTSAPPATGRPRSLWRSRDFVLLWSGQAVSTFGTSVSTLALPLLVLALTRSPTQAGLIAAARLLPYLILSLLAGALVDRWNRKALMIRCDVLRWLALGSVPLAFAFGRLSLPQLYAVALVEGAANVFFGLAQISALPQVVTTEQLPRAWALSETTDSASALLGPGVAGFVISLGRTTAAGAVLAYLGDSLSYLVSVISLGFIRVRFQGDRSASADRRSLRAEMAEGLRFLWRQPTLRLLALLTSAVNFLQAPLVLVVIVLAQNLLRIDVRTLGIIISASGAGGLVGAAAAPKIKEHLRFGHIIVGSMVLWALAVATLALAGSPPLLMLGLALVNVVWPLYAVTVVTYRLSLVPDQMQGRINSAFRLLTFGAEPLGTALAGVLLTPLGPRVVLWGLAAGLTLTTLVAGMSELRRV